MCVHELLVMYVVARCSIKVRCQISSSLETKRGEKINHATTMRGDLNSLSSSFFDLSSHSPLCIRFFDKLLCCRMMRISNKCLVLLTSIVLCVELPSHSTSTYIRLWESPKTSLKIQAREDYVVLCEPLSSSSGIIKTI